MKNVTILFLFCTLNFPSFGQITDHIVYKQALFPIYKQAVEKHEFKKSIEQLEAVKKRFGKLYGEDYLLMSYCYKEIGDDSLAAISIKQAYSIPTFDMRVTWYIADLNPGYISKGFSEQDMKLKDEGFENYVKKPSSKCRFAHCRY